MAKLKFKSYIFKSSSKSVFYNILKNVFSYKHFMAAWTYLGKTVNRNVLQYYAIIGCDATSFFYINEKINPLKEVLKKQAL